MSGDLPEIKERVCQLWSILTLSSNSLSNPLRCDAELGLCKSHVCFATPIPTSLWKAEGLAASGFPLAPLPVRYLHHFLSTAYVISWLLWVPRALLPLAEGVSSYSHSWIQFAVFLPLQALLCAFQNTPARQFSQKPVFALRGPLLWFNDLIT